jgi:hypothetical protein
VNQNSPSARIEKGELGEDRGGLSGAGFAKLEIDPEFMNRDR